MWIPAVIQQMISPEVKLFLNYQCPTDGAKDHHSCLSPSQYGQSLLPYNHQKLKQSSAVFCGLRREVVVPDISDPTTHSTWNKLVEATVQGLKDTGPSSAADYQTAEWHILQKSQIYCFPEEYKLLKAGKSVPSTSQLLALAPEFDNSCQLIRVGCRLRWAEGLELSVIHPVVLDPHHWVTKLLIGDYDSKLCHPGPEWVFREMRRNFWILRGWEAIRKQQHLCKDCKKWKNQPVIPRMTDLPPTQLRLLKPPFYSTGMDCFRPFQFKIGRRCEKTWGIIFKCLDDVISN